MSNKVFGLVVGIVTDNEDPENIGRVCVKFPWLSDDQTFWVRIAQPMAGPGRGFQFIPEIEDEVIVGFEHGDVQYPVVLGSVWNGKDKPIESSSEFLEGKKVKHRIIKTRIGHELLFDDEDGKGEVKITTNGRHVLTLNDKDRKIEAQTTQNLKLTLDDSNNKIVATDAAGNSVTIDSGGQSITIKCNGNMSLEATGQISIKGTAGIQIESPAITSVKGSLVNINSG